MPGPTHRALFTLTACIAAALQISITAPACAAETPPAGAVDDARIRAESATGDNWLVNGAGYGQTHYSPLRAISQNNVGQLGLAWSLDIDSRTGLAVEPLMVDGTLYLAGHLDRVFAVDAASGRLRWQFDPKTPLVNINHSYSARSTRGVAVWNGKVYVGTGDCRLVAIDASSGKQLWEAPVCTDEVRPMAGITGAPRVGGGRVYIGYNGDTGARGSVVAIDAETGKLAWRAWNIPGDPRKGFENKALERAAATWKIPGGWKDGGGGVWEAITYDDQAKLVIYGTEGPHVDEDRLYSNSIVAVHADTGEFAWYVPTFKYKPAGYSGGVDNFHVLVTELDVKGQKRRVVLTAPRFGALFVIDVKTGEIISQRLIRERPADQQSPPTAAGEPRSRTDHNWFPMSFSPQTGLLYIPAFDDIADRRRAKGTALGRLIAWDPASQTARWSVGQPYSLNGGALSTAGGLVFQGQGSGEFVAYGADSGRVLWSVKTGSSIQSTPITYRLNGEQFILLPVGYGSNSRLFGGNTGFASSEAMRGPARLYAFKIGGQTPFPYPQVTVPPVPRPPEQTADAQTIERGHELVRDFSCWSCHGGDALDGIRAWELDGAIPDLRYMPAQTHAQFLAIVLGGTRRAYGMPGFSDGQSNPGYPPIPKMTAEQAQAIHAFIVSQAWKAYDAEQAAKRNNAAARPASP